VVIVCGWCGQATAGEWETTALMPTGETRCQSCGHEDPARPWVQRGDTPPSPQPRPEGRPPLDASQIRQRLRIARKEHPDATNAELAEALDISERTLGRWLKVAS
jgi:hypothetical protein